MRTACVAGIEAESEEEAHDAAETEVGNVWHVRPEAGNLLRFHMLQDGKSNGEAGEEDPREQHKLRHATKVKKAKGGQPRSSIVRQVRTRRRLLRHVAHPPAETAHSWRAIQPVHVLLSI